MAPRSRAGWLQAWPLLVCAIVCACAEAPGQGSSPNVVLVVIDTLRKDHLGCYGYSRNTSPHLDQLAEEAVVFDHAVSQAPWTTPSIGSLLTSWFPTTLGIKSERSALPEEATLLSEVLQEHGYATGAVVSHTFCSADWGFDQGFDEFDESNIEGHLGVSSPGVTDRGLQFVERHRDGPFFLWLHYFDPHSRYLLHDEFDSDPSTAYDGPVSTDTSFAELRAMDLGDADMRELIRYYDSEIAFTDHHIGRFLDGLETLGLFDETLVIVTADHGEEFLDHGKFGHAHSLYQELIGVPLIIKPPAAAGLAPRRVDDIASLVDVLPTVLSVLGLPPPERIAGTPLLGRSETDGGSRTAFAETSRYRRLRAAVTADAKAVVHVRTGRVELYDLAADPREQEDLRTGRPERFEPLLTAVGAWRDTVERWRLAPRTVKPTAEQEERLRSLGYVEP